MSTFYRYLKDRYLIYCIGYYKKIFVCEMHLHFNNNMTNNMSCICENIIYSYINIIYSYLKAFMCICLIFMLYTYTKLTIEIVNIVYIFFSYLL